MDHYDVQLLVDWARLSQIEQRWVPAATIVLHDCLVAHDLPCGLEFRRLVLTNRLLSARLSVYGEAADSVSCSATVAGIRVQDGLFNAHGLDPWQDASRTADRSVYYLRWAKEKDLGYLGHDSLDLARRRWGHAINAAVGRLALLQRTPVAHGEREALRL